MRALLIPLVLTACLGSATPPPSGSSANTQGASNTLLVDVLDVGQGDAILLRTSEGKVALIDGGPSGEPLLAGLRERKIDHIDLMIATHPHSDHIGGLDEALAKWPVSVFIDSGDVHTTASYDRLMAAVEDEGLRYQTAAVGDVINLGSEVRIELMGPPSPRLKEGESRSHLNANSVIARVTHGSSCFLFTGDAELETEERLLHDKIAPCGVLKVAHHGSAYATSDAWLAAVQPQIALISAGKDNSYGHPAPSTLARLKAAGVTVYRTDTMGSIQLESDGSQVTVHVGDKNATVAASTPAPEPREAGGVNINTASTAELEQLPGIGPSKATAIVTYREANGPFASCDALEAVSGIGPATLERLRPQCRTR